jgi:hypothetical protein
MAPRVAAAFHVENEPTNGISNLLVAKQLGGFFEFPIDIGALFNKFIPQLGIFDEFPKAGFFLKISGVFRTAGLGAVRGSSRAADAEDYQENHNDPKYWRFDQFHCSVSL